MKKNAVLYVKQNPAISSKQDTKLDRNNLRGGAYKTGHTLPCRLYDRMVPFRDYRHGRQKRDQRSK